MTIGNSGNTLPRLLILPRRPWNHHSSGECGIDDDTCKAVTRALLDGSGQTQHLVLAVALDRSNMVEAWSSNSDGAGLVEDGRRDGAQALHGAAAAHDDVPAGRAID